MGKSKGNKPPQRTFEVDISLTPPLALKPRPRREDRRELELPPLPEEDGPALPVQSDFSFSREVVTRLIDRLKQR